MLNSISTGNFISNYFASTSRSSTVAGSFSVSMLSDFASIKNGSYGKLLKAYYSKNPTSSATKEEQGEKTQTSQLKSTANELAESAKELYGDSSLYEKKEIKTTDKDGKETTTVDYDKDALYKKVEQFVDDYNDMIKEGGASSSNSVLRSTLSAVQNTQSNYKMLAKVGITMNSDNTLSVDEDSFKKAEMADIETMFKGTGSYAYKVGSKASSVSNYATTSLSASSLYTNKATTYMDNAMSSWQDYYL